MRRVFAFLTLFLILEAKPFVVGHLQYDLGNQMFQAAATIAYAFDNGYDAYFPNLGDCPWWDLAENRNMVFSKLNPNYPKDPIEFVYPDDGSFPIPPRPNSKIHGLFQSEKYFRHHKEKIIDLFSPSPDILNYIETKYGSLLEHPCTVGLHVRTYVRDYGYLPTIDEVHWFVGVEYYEKAVKQFPEDALFLICSDDIEWCKKNLSHIAPNVIFIEGNRAPYDFYLLSLCDHVITANSTFSWWAAYLNKNPNKKIVTVDNWFGQWWAGNTEKIVLKDWIRISRGKR